MGSSIKELKEAMQAGKLGKGLTMLAKLGDDAEAVLTACQSVPTAEEKAVLESDAAVKKGIKKK